MSERLELLDATDAEIEDAVRFADPMILRGLLYQLTGDESVAETEVQPRLLGLAEAMVLAHSADAELLQTKAADYLKALRDSGAGDAPIGSLDRLATSLSLTCGEEFPAADAELWVEQVAVDQWVRALDWREEPAPERLEAFSVVVIGAGGGGLGAAVYLERAGVPYVVVEKNTGVGGTWFENRYPGARVDTASRAYTHTFGVGFEYPNPFCAQVENEKYFNWIADEFGVRDHIEFETEVKSVVWDDDAKVWDISAVGPNGPRTWRANAVISGVGFLARPNLPDIDGLADFDGPVFHTARWPSDLDLGDKRVAVIGSGCTSYQMIPELVKMASHTYLFQRTPNWCFDVPGYRSPYPPQVNWLDRNLPYFNNFARFRSCWLSGPEKLGAAFNADPAFEDPHARSAANKRARDARLEFMKRKFADHPELLEAMLPVAPPFSSRPVLVDSDYSVYDALLRDDCDLVTEGIKRITKDGIELEGGGTCAVDVVVLATGFKANDFLWPMEVRGRDGQLIEQLWEKDGARAYLGTMLPGFPNLFMIYGPNTNATGGLGTWDFEEMVIRFALQCIEHLVLEGKQEVDVTADAYWRYNDELDRHEALKIYTDPRADNYYRNAHGRSAANSPFDIRQMWSWLRRPSGEGERPRVGDDGVRPYFGDDLVVS